MISRPECCELVYISPARLASHVPQPDLLQMEMERIQKTEEQAMKIHEDTVCLSNFNFFCKKEKEEFDDR